MIQDKIPSKGDVRATFRVTYLVMKTPRYLLLWLLLTPLVLLLLLLPTDYRLIVDTIILGESSVQTKLTILYQILPLTGSYTYSVFTDGLLYVTSTLVSVNITLLLYHFMEHDMNLSDGTGGTFATIVAVLGSGCASCGSALIVGLFSLFGAGGVLTLLPLGGGEFLILASIITIVSIIWISKGLRGGMVRGCPIK